MSKKIYINENQFRKLVCGLNEAYVSEEYLKGVESSDVLANCERNREMISGLEFISYGASSFDIEKVRELKIDGKNMFIQVHNKPIGGVWASPVDAKNGWADFLEGDDWNLRSLSNFFRFKVKGTAKIYVIDTFEDLIAVSKRYVRYDRYDGMDVYGIDFEALYNFGCDGIFITDKASVQFHDIEYEAPGGYRVSGLNAWDVCSICIFKPEVMVLNDENAFEKASFPKRGLNVDDEMLQDEWRTNGIRDRYWLQMQSDFEKYGNQNVKDNSKDLFGGKHPAIMAQAHGNSKEAKLARKYNGTIKSGMK